MNRTWAILLILPLGGVAGCSLLSAEILEVQEAAPLSRDGTLEGVAFDCVVRTRSADQEQLVYRVNVLNARGRLIASYDRQFSDSRGNVAAQRTFLVGTSLPEDQRLRVIIPIEQLEVTPDDMPFGALYGIYRANDECLAAVRKQARLPARARAALDEYHQRRFQLSPPDAAGTDEPPSNDGSRPPAPHADRPEQSLSPAVFLPSAALLARGS